MRSTTGQIVIALAVLVATVFAGWAATGLFQSVVPIAPGVQGCARLDGASRQVACLADEFLEGADEAARGSRGRERDRSVAAYVRRVERQAASGTRLGGLCHPAMHELGRREGSTAARQERVPGFPGGSSQLCTAGYVHGLAEGYLAGTTSADVAAVFPKLCHDEQARAGCAHGVGHALLRARVGQPAVAASRSALHACDELPAQPAGDCHDGVFMELAMRSEPAKVPVSSFVATCRSSEDTDRSLSCWGYLSLSITTNDVPVNDIPAWCSRAPLPAQFTCLDGYGRALGVQRVSRCESSADVAQLQERCVDGAIGLEVGSGHVSRSEARAACRELTAGRLQRHCAGAVERYSRGRRSVESET